MLDDPVALQQPIGQRNAYVRGQRVKQAIDMPQIAPEVLQLLLDPPTKPPFNGALHLRNRQVILTRFFPIGPGFSVPGHLGVEPINDRFAELARFVEQTQIGGIAYRLWRNGGVQNELSLNLRRLL